MSVLLNVCGLILSTQTIPDTTLTQFYQQYYQCDIQVLAQEDTTSLAPQYSLSAYFPNVRQWWPVFTIDQVGSASYKRIIQHGIKPGLILPNEYFNIRNYYKAKKAVSEGAIPLALYESRQPHYFASKATFSTAIGLRPLGAFTTTGWDNNLNLQPAGTYIVQNQNNNTLPLPTREILDRSHYFYHAQQNTEQGNGYQVIVNPSTSISLDNIRYPKLGIAWTFNDIDYLSTPEQIQTNAFGYLFIVLSTVVIPLDFILPRTYPDVLRFFGSSISWISLLLGGILLLIFIVSIFRKVRSHGAD
ncbi:hypothetical protein RFI02_08750 [Acinetobacter sichuanensis]|uniref:hypothetical protein n=1 Tax=Acinetobacter sichuanensis TaxID=2136183 RepID=UPI00280EC6A1|nr:hypothetical protein [Acinetobacter sichuanensis]MDQ9021192.1 hypothetical protein [Acinetobacter sichuanensis]